jgi:D-alanyl-D-alanine dipeptidase
MVLALLPGAAQAKRRAAAAPAAPKLLDSVQQLVLVTTPDWSSPVGVLRRYARKRPAGPWRALGPAIPVDVGRNGMAWGKGLHGAAPGEPVKKEGDGRAPAGAFRLSAVFGYAPAMSTVKMPYVPALPTMDCIDDPASAHYNTLIDRARISQPDWRSSERMLRPDGLYRVGVFVEHNTSPAVPNAGSCIFLHIWSKSGQGTAGCTAFDAARVEELANWLDPALSPTLVQLPEAEYRRLKGEWRLP